MAQDSFTYIDLFAGIGGFHAALSALGGTCVYASEIDKAASKIYSLNWGIDPLGDITKDANEEVMKVPKHDVLVAGFPCQPFSKSGSQKGMEETRGTLYWNILNIIRHNMPTLVLLENVRNLCGPRHKHEWEVIIRTLRESGYRVSEYPWILSPHNLPPELGGRPHARERVFIAAVKTESSDKSVPKSFSPSRHVNNWSPKSWKFARDLPLEINLREKALRLTEQQDYWLRAWDDFVRQLGSTGSKQPLPGFPLWGDAWRDFDETPFPTDAPDWKLDFLTKNLEFYNQNRKVIDAWAQKWSFYTDKFPPSRRKFEWQAGKLTSLRSTLIHLRPSGIRVKQANYAPALVAITQTSIIYEKRRYLSVREAARLQGLPDWFSFGEQPDRLSYKQLGNGISVGAIWYILKHCAVVFKEELSDGCPVLYQLITSAPPNPDDALNALQKQLRL